MTSLSITESQLINLKDMATVSTPYNGIVCLVSTKGYSKFKRWQVERGETIF